VSEDSECVWLAAAKSVVAAAAALPSEGRLVRSEYDPENGAATPIVPSTPIVTLLPCLTPPRTLLVATGGGNVAGLPIISLHDDAPDGPGGPCGPTPPEVLASTD
jgi:hypothetical protein